MNQSIFNWRLNLIKVFKVYILTTIVLFVMVFALFVSPVFAQGSSGSTAISLAQINLQSCYKAVKQAEAAGANVDSLMVNLNDAAGLLTKAQLAYASGDYISANSYASQSQSTLAEVTSQAQTLRANALSAKTENSIITLLSVIGSVSILFSGIVAFVVLDRKGRRT